MALSRDLPATYQEALAQTHEILISSPQLLHRGGLDAEALEIVLWSLERSIHKRLSRMEFHTRLTERYPLDAGERALITALARTEGRPLQHLTGTQPFLDHEYDVGPDVLIPRPETEILAQAAIDELKADGLSRGLGLEIGLGSGILSIELLAAFPGLKMLASEISAPAARRAEQNARRILGSGAAAAHLQILAPGSPADVCECFGPALSDPADFLISNPPYLVFGEESEVEEQVKNHEPAVALFAPPGDALFFYRQIATRAGAILKREAPIFLELAAERAAAIQNLFEAAGWAMIRVIPDLNQRPRVLIARCGPSVVGQN